MFLVGILVMLGASAIGIMQAVMFPGVELSAGALFSLWIISVATYIIGYALLLASRDELARSLLMAISGLVAVTLAALIAYNILSTNEGVQLAEYLALISYVVLLFFLVLTAWVHS